ncbi:MAG TPA: ATP-binding protein [Alphaproteobacteria bacterium]|nr:ATP-binding protein [Alphaproteobacteria bacterium]
MKPRPNASAQDAAARARNDLAEAFARVLLSDGLVGSQAPVFFQEPDGTMIWANDGYYGLATLLANAPAAQRLLHPDYESAPVGNGQSWTASERAMLNGRAVIVRASYAKVLYGARQKPALAGFVQVAPDESDHLRDLAVARERANDIMRLVSDWVWEADAEGVLTFASERVQRTTGFHPQELIGAPLTRLAAGSQAAEALMARLMSLAPFRDFSVQARAKDGSERTFLISAVPVFAAEGGAHAGFRGTANDITGLSEREQSILAAKEAAEQANRAKAQFLSNMSHELRTPLNAIIGFSDMIAGAVHGPLGAMAYGQYAGDINSSARHLLAIINDILEVAKIEAGRLALVEEETSVGDLCNIALRLVKERAEQRSVQLRSEVAPALPNVILDQRAMRQVLLNLLSNAVKFTKAGGEVTLRAQLAMDGDLMLQVCDTGIGMREDDLNRVLQPFVQAESELGRKFEGTGLGLSLSKQLIELHGGRLGIVSKPDFGTTVTVYLPGRRLVRG